MVYRLLADLTLAVHFAFILFVVFGGLLVARWPRLAWLHVPAAVYGALIEFVGWTCPLTPLENHFRRLGGEAGYRGGFIEHYLLPLIYPERMTRAVGVVLGLGVVVLNLAIYGWILRRARRGRAKA